MPTFAGGLTRKDLRVANAWAVKTDKMIDSSGVKFPAYFLSADIIAPSGEAVVGTWVTTEITKGGLIFSVSPQAKKYTNWDTGRRLASTAGITMETAGAKASVAVCWKVAPDHVNAICQQKVNAPGRCRWSKIHDRQILAQIRVAKERERQLRATGN